MAPRIQEIEAPDTLARTQATLGNLRETTEDMIGEKLIINMGPSHPATHGVLRIVLELDGETHHQGDARRGLPASWRRKNRGKHAVQPVRALHGPA